MEMLSQSAEIPPCSRSAALPTEPQYTLPYLSGHPTDVRANSEELYFSLQRACRNSRLPVNLDIIHHAIKMAHHAHRAQPRQNNRGPYIDHPLRIAIKCAKRHLDETTIVSAILHDSVEDSDGAVTNDNIRAQFGEVVAFVVGGLTKLKRTPEDGEGENEAANMLHLMDTGTQDGRVLIIKTLDREDNASSLGGLEDRKREKVAKETSSFHLLLANAVGMAESRDTLEDCAYSVREPGRSSSLNTALTKLHEEMFQPLEIVRERISTLITELQISGRVDWTLAPTYLVAKRLGANEPKLENLRLIDDIFLFDIVIDSSDDRDCFSIEHALAKEFTPRNYGREDLIARPHRNGYSALCAYFSSDVTFKTRICLATMSARNTYGIAANWTFTATESVGLNRFPHLRWVEEHFSELKKHGVGNHVALLEEFRLRFDHESIRLHTHDGKSRVLPPGSNALEFYSTLNPHLSVVPTRVFKVLLHERQEISRTSPLQNGDMLYFDFEPREDSQPDTDLADYCRPPWAKARPRAVGKK